MPEPGREPRSRWKLDREDRHRGLRRVELQRRRLRGELCPACADDRPNHCTGAGTHCPGRTPSTDDPPDNPRDES